MSSGTPSRHVPIDALRGVVMLAMLVDHVREFFYLHAQVADPMDLGTTPPSLFASRLLAHLCAPIFVALTGLSAWLYGQHRGGKPAAAAFLFKRGLFLIVLELTVINFAWTFSLPPQTIFLQVIWVIGLSMIALSGLLWLPRPALLAIGLSIVFGHNLLDPIAFAPGEYGHALWALLHDRGYIALSDSVRARSSYPLLPWIGVVALGWSAGTWFGSDISAPTRRRRLLTVGVGALVLFLSMRAVNVYGDPHPWELGSSPVETAMSFVNLTKYPPSAVFILLTIGTGALLLVLLEQAPGRALGWIAVFGAVPLFFYIAHLYLLHLLNLLALSSLGPNHGRLFSLPSVAALWLLAGAVAAPLWFLCRWFAGVKRRSNYALLSYL
nr:heparan-alpha-glucosaminide N-acetyltransferase domain-containing protein [Sphingomonas deserti]